MIEGTFLNSGVVESLGHEESAFTKPALLPNTAGV